MATVSLIGVIVSYFMFENPASMSERIKLVEAPVSSRHVCVFCLLRQNLIGISKRLIGCLFS